MKEKALKYYLQGYNCSQCMVMAAGEYYNINVTDEMIDALNGVNIGFGVGSICSVLVGAIMAFGLMLNEEATKRARIKLLDLFAQNNGGNISCPSLKNRGKAGGCEELVCSIAKMTEQIINDEIQRS